MARKPNPDRGKFLISADPEELRAWLQLAEAESLELTPLIRREMNAAVRRWKRRAQ